MKNKSTKYTQINTTKSQLCTVKCTQCDKTHAAIANYQYYSEQCQSTKIDRHRFKPVQNQYLDLFSHYCASSWHNHATFYLLFNTIMPRLVSCLVPSTCTAAQYLIRFSKSYSSE